VHGGGGSGASLEGDCHLGVVNAREVAGAGWLVLLGLQCERIGVHTWVWVATVVVVGLHLVEVLAVLLLEAVLAVKHKLEGGQWANSASGKGAILVPRECGQVGVLCTSTLDNQWHAGLGGGCEGHGVTRSRQIGVNLDLGVASKRHIAGSCVGREVPHGSVGGGVGEAPHQLLHWVVVGQAHLLGGGGINGVSASVLHLLDKVLVTLLGEAAALLGVKVDVVTPHLGGVGAEIGLVVRSQVDVQAHLVVLQGDQWQVEAWVAVEEEDQWQVHLASFPGWVGGHLAPLSLLGLIEAQLGVHAPPLLVVLVDALATDGQLDVSHGALSHPAGIWGSLTSDSCEGTGGDLEVHVTDKVTVAGNGHGKAAAVGGGAVHGLLDVLHGKVGVALVHRLEEGNLGVTGKEDILCAISYELHETTCHCCLYFTPRKYFWVTHTHLTHLPPLLCFLPEFHGILGKVGNTSSFPCLG